MKKGNFIFLCILILLTTNALASEPISFFNLMKKNNLFYKKASSIPYSGQVEGIKKGHQAVHFYSFLYDLDFHSLNK